MRLNTTHNKRSLFCAGERLPVPTLLQKLSHYRCDCSKTWTKACLKSRQLTQEFCRVQTAINYCQSGKIFCHFCIFAVPFHSYITHLVNTLVFKIKLLVSFQHSEDFHFQITHTQYGTRPLHIVRTLEHHMRLRTFRAGWKSPWMV